MKKTCYVTATSDPLQEWMQVEATSVFHAAIYYSGACAARPAGPPAPQPDDIIAVRVGDKIYKVLSQRAMEWANARAETAARERLKRDR